MLDADARMAAVNSRVARLRLQRKRRVNAALSTFCAVLCLGLIGVIELFSGRSSSVAVDGLFGSSSLMGSNVGGYVLVALMSFSLAVIATLLCLRRKSSNQNDPDDGVGSSSQAGKREGDER